MSLRRRVSLIAITCLLGTLSAVEPVAAGCSINVKFVNNDPDKAYIYTYNARSKIRGGWWKDLNGPYLEIPANSQKSHTFELSLGCNHDRRYKFPVNETIGARVNTVWYYKPSATGYTRSTSLTVKINM
jgi:hypothetical protein